MLTEDNIAIVSEMELLTERRGASKEVCRAARGNNAEPSNVARLACTKTEECSVAVTVAHLMPAVWLLIGAIALIAWVTTPLRQVRDARDK
jgi:hypothetical protein